MKRELVGWRGIARHLGWTQLRAKRWGRRGPDPLPARIVCGRIVCDRDDLDAWVRRHTVRPIDTRIVTGQKKPLDPR